TCLRASCPACNRAWPITTSAFPVLRFLDSLVLGSLIRSTLCPTESKVEGAMNRNKPPNFTAPSKGSWIQGFKDTGTKEMIEADGLTKTYRVAQKKEGVLGALRGLYHREYREVRAIARN